MLPTFLLLLFCFVSFCCFGKGKKRKEENVCVCVCVCVSVRERERNNERKIIIYYYSRLNLVENWEALFKMADGSFT